MGQKIMPKEPIVIVGSACRFAGDVNTPSKLWELLRDPQDVRSEIFDSRFSIKGFYHPNPNYHGHMNVKHSYLLNEDPTAFDAEFFGINPLEARAMDPQQRLLLETVYESIESAGMTVEGLQGSDTAVFAGVMTGDYEAMLLRDMDVGPTYCAVGTSRAILSNRISYFFDWHGASVTMDTACSSSLVALHSAVQTLREGDSRMAIACGSNVILGPENYIIESKVKMLSPDGVSRMWDKDANGYARGDGVAAIALKTLSAALEDNDHIECVIRETGLNQDGTTTGLTMPSATAQRALIQRTYAKLGLDPSVEADRPQYFEAHGTGTPAGDPVEAEAISSAFFAQGTKTQAGSDPLFVGSIKTVLGHTEGTAGIAAILKASLAMQNSCIPPNLLFNELSPAVAPFYGNLEILRAVRPWPEVPKNQPKRASVNSFGFGGANAHAILESYEKPYLNGVSDTATFFTPYVFSAASEKSLRANLVAYTEYIDAHSEISPRDLAYTLRERRSVLPYRISFPASDLDRLKNKILMRLEDKGTNLGVRTLGRKGSVAPSRILGVFTGQGGQYARMGAELIDTSPLARSIIRNLEAGLAALPEEDRPTWSLEAEILAEPEFSRMSESAISQPLNTAVQIMLVDLLRSAGVQFDGIIGHSGGEVAAAYAAGFLTARDALCVAYYRGMVCRLAASPNGDVKGAMLAVGTSIEDATQFCEEEEFAGRIVVACVNSSSSVTISGDEDAIDELAVIMDDEKKFNRRLKVDNAYHSMHMRPLVAPYLKGISRAGVKAIIPSSSHQCTWYSSVFNGNPVDLSFQLSDKYWVENMIRPVLFSQALTAALNSGTVFDTLLEIGPHAALKSPALQTVQDVMQKTVPYQGALTRGVDAVEAFSATLGMLWSHLDRSSLSLQRGEIALSGKMQHFNVLKSLPTYQWNHDTKYWHESRRSRQIRLRPTPVHPLLGDATAESGPHALRWKNILKPSEMQWVEGHSVQGQIVLPAAAYVSTALEAAKVLAGEKIIRLIELDDFLIHQAVTFGDNDEGVEVLIEMCQISKAHSDVTTAKFTYSAALGGDNTNLSLAADGQLKIFLGDGSESLLPERQPAPPHMIPVDETRLYKYMEGLEYNFSGAFRSLVKLQRKLGKSICVAKRASEPGDECDSLLVHPVDLDAAFQSIMLAYSYPGDEQLRTLHLPTSIAKIRVNPAILAEEKERHDSIDVDSSCNPIDRSTPGSGFSGNVNMYFNGCSNTAIQVDQVIFKPVGTDANDDRKIFCTMDYVPSKLNGYTAASDIPVSEYETQLMWGLSRIVNFYVRQFDREVPKGSPFRTESPLCHYLNYAQHMNGLLDRGEAKYAKQEWMSDTIQDVMEDLNAKGIASTVDVRIMLLVGEIMPKVFRGETNMLEHFRTSGLLDEYYSHGFGTSETARWLGRVVNQITDRSPHLNLLEIGAGTGAATKYILPAIGKNFDSFTFTDITSSFFENASEEFKPWGDRMIFKACDAEQDPVDQGFVEGAYDVIIACQVLHATKRLDHTVRNIRKLLKPGGFLLIGEGSSEGMCQLGASFIFGTLPGWWAGVGEGRTLSPLVSFSQWDAILKRNGFSGIDTMAPPDLLDTLGLNLLVSQATDARIDLIREPLSSPGNFTTKEVVIVGGETAPVAHLTQGLERIFTDLGSQVHIFKTLEEMDDRVSTDGGAIICLADLDEPVFKDITPERWQSFKKLFEGEKSVLWLTKGRLADEPYCNMTVGFGRSAVHEEEDLNLQYMDVPDPSKVEARTIAEAFVRLTNKQLAGTDILYTVEPEIIVDAEGRELVPRLGHISAANNRLNSTRRHISHEVDVRKSVVELQQDSNGCFVRQLSRYEVVESPSSVIIEMRVTHAILSALKTPVGHRFLALGVDSSGLRHLALVSSLTSILKVPKESAVLCDISDVSEDAILTLTAAQLIAMAIIDPIFAGQKLIVHNASNAIAAAITCQALAKGVKVIFTTDDVDTSFLPSSWTVLPPYLGRSDLSQMIPADVVCFVGLSTLDSDMELAIMSTLSPYCRKESRKTIYASSVNDTGTTLPSILGRSLERASEYIQTGDMTLNPGVVRLEALADKECVEDPLTVVDWTAATTLPARVTRFDIRPLFKSDKTYWLCGLSGALGISLCDWMIERGMRYLVLTSRNPKIDPVWIEDHKRNSGVVIKTISCDVTDEKALRIVHQAIVETFPPIVGVLNGAMVLRDVSVRNMSFEQVTDVIRPKVLGSIHLDRIFHDIELDFFILLSSANCIIGNAGQANYAAANMGMCAVAANRRGRGLRSSTANVGAIIGVGYITESARQLDLTVISTHLTHLNEEDFHQIFAEVMEAGYLDSPLGLELSTGLLEVSTDDPNMPKWFTDPKFGRLIVNKTAGADDKKERMNEASILDSLQGCKSEQDVFQVVQQAFAAQLRKTLQITTSDEEIINMRSSNLGLDSLISVDIRSWFLKNFQVSIPVLKIMAGDAQMSSLVEAAVAGIPSELVPQVPRQEKSISSGTDDGDEPGGPIDWEAEVTPPKDMPTLTDPNAKVPDPNPKVILLTGASGLLGHHLVNALAAEPSITKIICVAVRRLSERIKTKQLPPPSARLVYYEGDLGLPRFGLTEEQQEDIFSEVDAVIHNGADTSHLKYYMALKETNVESTRQLVRLCLQRMVPLHYVSSAGMALYAGMPAFPEISGTTSGAKPPVDGTHGYMCAKWVSESYLELVNAAHGLKIWIHRPSTIVREGSDATEAKADFDWVNALIHYAHRTRAVPKVENNQGAFDLVYVHSVCDDIVGEMLRNEPRLDNGLTYVHNVGDIVIPMNRMAEIGKHKGIKSLYKVLPWDVWIATAIKAGLHPAVAALVELFDAPGAQSYPLLLKEKRL